MWIETLNWEIQHHRFIYNIVTFQISTCVNLDLVFLAHVFKLMEEFEIVGLSLRNILCVGNCWLESF